MVCNQCGQPLLENSQFCGRCGKAVAPQASVATAVPSAAPVYATPETSGLAIGSLIAGIFSFIFPAAIAAIVLGHIARSNIRKSAGRLAGDGMALAGLILGYMGLAFIPVILIIAAIAIPNLLRARIAANETSAVNSVRIFNTTESAYRSAHPSTGYSCSMSDLEEVGLGRLAEGRKNGYVFELTGCTPDKPGGSNTKFMIMASPMIANQTGVRVFCSDQTLVIKASSDSASVCSANGQTLQ